MIDYTPPRLLLAFVKLFGMLSMTWGLAIAASYWLWGTVWPGVVVTALFWLWFAKKAFRQLEEINRESARKRFSK